MALLLNRVASTPPFLPILSILPIRPPGRHWQIPSFSPQNDPFAPVQIPTSPNRIKNDPLKAYRNIVQVSGVLIVIDNIFPD